eukprot:TRINITY_DN113668_c0_g1_i1.p2 TRINITY_DN113668_c0_g1~~TRINITY_DN113668_c0_g1_i1.p2  ORF type:complete len:143 (-),score=45.12 TRINITY_DN113668_c0_g1_i1:161-589(-)
MALVESRKQLTLAGAHVLVQNGLEVAQKLGLKVTMAVVDAGGNLVCLHRMDGAMAVSSRIADGKARSAVVFARETMLLEGGSNVKDGGGRTALLSAGEVMMGGGVPILVDGQIVGAVGVSGATPQQDQEVAKACQSFIMSKL